MDKNKTGNWEGPHRLPLGERAIIKMGIRGSSDATSDVWRRQELNSIPKRKRTPSICLQAVKHDGMLLEFVPRHIRTPSICYAAVNECGKAIRFVPLLRCSPELCQRAVERDPLALGDVPKGDRSWWICGHALRAVYERIVSPSLPLPPSPRRPDMGRAASLVVLLDTTLEYMSLDILSAATFRHMCERNIFSYEDFAQFACFVLWPVYEWLTRERTNAYNELDRHWVVLVLELRRFVPNLLTTLAARRRKRSLHLELRSLPDALIVRCLEFEGSFLWEQLLRREWAFREDVWQSQRTFGRSFMDDVGRLLLDQINGIGQSTQSLPTNRL